MKTTSEGMYHSKLKCEKLNPQIQIKEYDGSKFWM